MIDNIIKEDNINNNIDNIFRTLTSIYLFEKKFNKNNLDKNRYYLINIDYLSQFKNIFSYNQFYDYIIKSDISNDQIQKIDNQILIKYIEKDPTFL